ncbi:hypothetical protein HD806DRAFT_539687 [Xylariaceae sp. AK1471]|nr:hypothetical protein HD806DRAFT_539687 [Xylariaceae sp. AK1471]
MTSQFAFVTIDGNRGKVKEEDRDLVRSRCMRGKNKREGSRRSLREAKRSMALPHRTKHQPLGSLLRKGATPTTSTLPSSGSEDSPDEYSTPNNTSQDTNLRVINMRAEKRHLGPSLGREIVRFISEDTPTYPRELVFTVQTFLGWKNTSYPVYEHLYFDDKVKESLLQYRMQDDLFRHIIYHQVSVFKLDLKKQSLSPDMLKCHQTAQVLLNNRLSDLPKPSPANFNIWNITIWSITMLAHAALWLGRHDEVALHILAVKRLCHIYGGKDYIPGLPTLRYYLFSLELASSIGSGQNPLPSPFDSRHRAREPHIVQSETPQIPLPLSASTFLASMSVVIDPRVLRVFRSLQEVTHNINILRAQGRLPHASTFQAFYDSALSRLLSLKDSLDDVTSECLRLGLLAFLTLTAYRASANRLGPGNPTTLYPYLTNRFRDACRAVELSTPQLSTLMLWLLTIGAMSVFNVDSEDWLVEKWKEAAQVLPGVLLSWENVIGQLESVMWMRFIYDDMGHKVYDKITRS